MIELRNASQRFAGPNDWVKALDGIDLTIPPGEIFGIIGRSGAGKSTPVRTITFVSLVGYPAMAGAVAVVIMAAGLTYS